MNSSRIPLKRVKTKPKKKRTKRRRRRSFSESKRNLNVLMWDIAKAKLWKPSHEDEVIRGWEEKSLDLYATFFFFFESYATFLLLFSM